MLQLPCGAGGALAPMPCPHLAALSTAQEDSTALGLQG